jgi:hypothetical protein
MQAASVVDEVLIQLGENVQMYIRTRAKPNIRVNLKGNAKYVYHQQLSMLLTHFIYEFYPSDLLEKVLKYDKITLLGFILTISTSFGESMNLQGLFRKYAKKPP